MNTEKLEAFPQEFPEPAQTIKLLVANVNGLQASLAATRQIVRNHETNRCFGY